MKYANAERVLTILLIVQKVGRLSVHSLAQRPGWTKSTASRQLSWLAGRGWLERVTDGRGRPVYLLGPQALQFETDLRFIA